MDIDYIKNVLEYNKDTGIFTWKEPVSNRIKVGDIAGTPTKDGYLRFSISGKKVLAHRIAWAYEYGEIPKEYIDHINGNKSDNRICNLRPATNSENQFNKGIVKNNSTGYRGVHYNKKLNKYSAKCVVKGVAYHLGVFDCPESASLCYEEFCKMHHKEYYHTI